MAAIPTGGRRGGLPAVGLLLVLAAGLGGAVYFASAHHFVRTHAGLRVYSKAEAGFGDTYLDVRPMTFRDLRQHEGVVRAMIAAGDVAYLPGGEALQKAAQGGADPLELIWLYDSAGQLTASQAASQQRY